MRQLPTPVDVGDYPKFDVTTYKALLGQRLLIGVCLAAGVAFFWELGSHPDDHDMAKFILESFLYFFAFGVLGVNAGQYGLQRFSSKEREEARERARLAAPPPTREHQALANIEQADQVIVPQPQAEPAAPAPPVSHPPAPPSGRGGGPLQRPTGDARVDDERGVE